MDHNPFLTPDPGDKGGPTAIEPPGGNPNIAWQTRFAPPTAAENALGDALQAIFGAGVDDLPGIVERLNAMVPPPGGAARWTEDGLRAELARLGR